LLAGLLNIFSHPNITTNKRFLTPSIRQAAEEPKEGDLFFAISDSLDDALVAVEDWLLQRESLTRKHTAGDDEAFNALVQSGASSLALGLLADGETKSAGERFSALFPSEDRKAIDRLLSYFTRQELAVGQVLWSGGNLSHSMAFVAEGKFFSSIDEGGSLTTTTVHEGNLVGDYAFLADERHSSTLTVTQAPCVVFTLDRGALARVLASGDAGLAFMLSRLTIRYLGHRTSHVSNRIWESQCVPI